ARLARRKFHRWIIALFLLAQIGGFAWMIGARFVESNWGHALPKFAVAAIFIWHLLGLPLALLTAVLALPFLLVRWLARRLRHRTEGATAASAANELSRRDFLGAAAAFAPPLFTISLTGVALAQLNNFRVRRLVLSFPALPAPLDGVTIVQVSDMHV